MAKLPTDFSCVAFKGHRCEFEGDLLKCEFGSQSLAEMDPIDFTKSFVTYGELTSKFTGPHNKFGFRISSDEIRNLPLVFEFQYYDGRVGTVKCDFLFADLADLPSTFYNPDILQLYTENERYSDPELLDRTLNRIFNKISSDKNTIITMAMSAYEWHLLHMALDKISHYNKNVPIYEAIHSFLEKFLALMKNDVVYPCFQDQYRYFLAILKSCIHAWQKRIY
jgi:hypothetical protein